MPDLELWGGVECTVNRVGDRWLDQLEKNGHPRRLGDIARVAALGLRALRFPALWERHAPRSLEDIDWRWTDTALARLRELGVRPIVGFVHHGSGPAYTSLLDERFPEKLALYAAAFARRYPWVDAYTPVNEPLTTARFGGLYGLWHPHGKDRRVFTRILMNETRAIADAMRAVRAVNPGAALVLTDDLGRASATPRLAYQARFDNHRRWLGFDLMIGRVDSGHRLYKWLRSSGIAAAELEAFVTAPCAPDIIGVNHYVTSNRYLDEDLARYPAQSHGGNGRHRYADVEAVRVHDAPFVSPESLLAEAWDRYGLPIAITEAHIGCTRDEQMRWLMEVWDGALAARRRGIDVRAVTCWSLFGAYDWDSLVTRDAGHYEPGAFDVRHVGPRPTALAHLARVLASGERPDPPVLDSPGWWRRPCRVEYPQPPQCVRERLRCVQPSPGRGRELLITGAHGTLGQAFARICELRGLAYRLADRRMLDIADVDAVRHALGVLRPWAVINAAGYCRVDDAEGDEDACRRGNTLGPRLLAEGCAGYGTPLVTFSSDLVFDGLAREPYRESDAVAPLGVYGRSKAAAEEAVLQAHPGALVVRTSAFFGPWDEHNFVTATLRNLARGEAVRAASDETVSPTYVPDLVNAALDLMIDGAGGVWHLANEGVTSWADFGKRAAHARGYDAARVVAVDGASLGLVASRPAYSALGTEHGNGLMPPLDSALDRYIRTTAH